MTTIDDIADQRPGVAAKRLVHHYFDQDSKPVPAVLRQSWTADMGTEDIPKERYLSREWHDREVERVWKRSWQMACHLDEVLAVGDHFVYEVADLSILVVRSTETEIKAYWNSCLHRGTKLKDGQGNSSNLRCPFHSWTWALDGQLAAIPCQWDFPQVDKAASALPEVRVDTWGGFVFICMDPAAPSLAEWLDPIPDHFKAWPLEKRRVAAHARKVVDSNWKVALEAFIESYHVTTTHPHIKDAQGDFDTQYDILTDLVNRMITTIGGPAPVNGYDMTDQEVADSLATIGLVGPDGKPLDVPEGKSAREVLAEFSRTMWKSMCDADLSEVSDSEMLDAIEYYVFPNFMPWGGWGVPIAYRFLPYGSDPDKCVVEVYVIWPEAEGADRPKAPPVRTLGPDEGWADVAELGWLGPVLDQDMRNLPRIQQGLKTTVRSGIKPGAYQESRLRHYHRTLTRFLGE